MGNTGARSDFSRYARIRDKYTERLMKFGRPLEPGNGDNRQARRARDAQIRKALKRNMKLAEQQDGKARRGSEAVGAAPGGQAQGGEPAQEARGEAGGAPASEPSDDADALVPRL